MLRLGGKRLRRNADFHRLRAKYRGQPAIPTWLRRLFPDEEVLREFARLRDLAFHEYIEQAALLARRRRGRARVLAELQSLGGQLARLHGHPRRGDAAEAVETRMRILQHRLRLWRRLPPNMHQAQYYWHHAMVVIYEALRTARAVNRLPGSLVSNLCGWLSIPEIGLRCTRDTIKAAGRRFVIETVNEHRYRVYKATSRSTNSSSGAPCSTAAPTECCERCQKPLADGDHAVCEVMLSDQGRGVNPSGIPWEELRFAKR
jgi:hypothetical protein